MRAEFGADGPGVSVGGRGGGRTHPIALSNFCSEPTLCLNLRNGLCCSSPELQKAECSVYAAAVGGTREKPRARSDESIKYAAHSFRAPCPTRVPQKSPPAPCGAENSCRSCLGLLSAPGSSSHGLKTETHSPPAPLMK